MSNDAQHAPEPTLRFVGVIRSDLAARKNAPRQGDEGAPDAWLEVEPWVADALLGIAASVRWSAAETAGSRRRSRGIIRFTSIRPAC